MHARMHARIRAEGSGGWGRIHSALVVVVAVVVVIVVFVVVIVMAAIVFFFSDSPLVSCRLALPPTPPAHCEDKPLPRPALLLGFGRAF